jgi:flagellar basal-body rod protein FlgB
MIDNLLGSPAINVLERTLSFTEQRHQVILENLANVSTPGYQEKDVSVAAFEKVMGEAVDKTRSGFASDLEPEDTQEISFQGNQVRLNPQVKQSAQPFHDRGARSMEDLMGQMADNAEAHNMVTGLLKSRYDWLNKAISMRA